MHSEFYHNKAKNKTLAKCTGTLEEIETFMDSYKDNEDYKYNLTQSQNVIDWVKNPSTIDNVIQDSLNDLKEYVSELIKTNNTFKILDVGCYGGYIYDYLTEAFPNIEFQYTGVDIREDAIEGAKQLHTDSSNAQFKAVDIFKLNTELPLNYYDIVFCSRVLIHLPKFAEGLKNLLDVTKTCLFIVLQIKRRSWCKRNVQISQDNRKPKMDFFYRAFSKRDIKDVLESFNIPNLSISIIKHMYTSLLIKKGNENE